MPRARSARLLVLLVAAALLVACERTAELIPGDGATPLPTATLAATASSTAEGTSTAAVRAPTPFPAVANEVLAQSVVLVQSVDRDGVVRRGTGVVVDSAARLVLTAYSIVNPVAPDASQAYQAIEIGINPGPGLEPVPLFVATIVVADPTVDVAILRVVSMRGGGELGGSFLLPNVTRGDGAVSAGESIRIFAQSGAPDRNSELLTVTAAQITGLHDEIGREGRTRLKTDAVLPIEAVGGPAFDQAGELIGFVTAERYLAGGSVFELRPMDLANPLVRLAQRNPSRRHVAAPERGSATGGDPIAATASLPWLSKPRIAAGSSPTEAGADLFDFSQAFPGGTGALHYEFTAIGVPDGTLVEERWLFAGELQDHLSSTYVWDRGPAALVVDVIREDSAAGLEVGIWSLEVALDGATVTAAEAQILAGEVPIPGSDVAVHGFEFAAGVGSSHAPTAPAAAEAEALLLFFDYEGMSDITSIRWLVFHRGLLLFQSPDVPWLGGEQGRWWVGYRPDEPLDAGAWQFEVHIGSEIYASPTAVLR
jgi:S1-C subfamily serine protease